MSIYVPWLLDAARTTGYPVVEVPGWRTRGHGGYRRLEGVVGHHTGTSARAEGDYPSRSIVTFGRSDLAGPLCTFGLGRSGTIYVVAAGVAWHAGASAWAGYADLNDEFLGIEAESDGSGHWSARQLDCYPRLVAACLRYMRRDASRYASHRSVALPSGRKPDPTGITDNWMRERASALLAGEDDMPLSNEDVKRVADAVGARVWHWELPNPVVSTKAKPVPERLQTTVQHAEKRIVNRLAAAIAAAQRAMIDAVRDNRPLSQAQIRQTINEAMAAEIEVTGTVDISGRGDDA